jgi:hypothetical protein
MILSGESTAGECSQATTLLGKIFTGDDPQIRTTDAPGGIWTRYAQVSSTFKNDFQMFYPSARYCQAFMFFICNVYQKFGRFCKQNSKSKKQESNLSE